MTLLIRDAFFRWRRGCIRTTVKAGGLMRVNQLNYRHSRIIIMTMLSDFYYFFIKSSEPKVHWGVTNHPIITWTKRRGKMWRSLLRNFLFAPSCQGFYAWQVILIRLMVTSTPPHLHLHTLNYNPYCLRSPVCETPSQTPKEKKKLTTKRYKLGFDIIWTENTFFSLVRFKIQ